MRQRGAPQHRLLAAGVHGDVAADGGGVLRGGVDREGQVVGCGQVGDASGDDAGGAVHHRHRRCDAGQLPLLHRRQMQQLFGVDHRAVGVQWHRRAGVAGAAAARHDGQSAVDAGAHDGRHLLLPIRVDHHEGHLHAPVGGVGGMGDPGQAAEIDVVVPRHPFQRGAQAQAQARAVVQAGGEAPHRVARRPQQAGRLPVVVEPRFELVQPVLHGADQRLAAFAALHQVVLQIGVAGHYPHVAEHLEQHPRRAPGAARAAQLLDQVPHGLAEKADDNLAVGE
jgi:hypothetical protein